MDKTLFLIRHCASTGQEPDAPLTREGHRQAEMLAEQLSTFAVESIVSSPYARAVRTAEPLAVRLNLPVHTDDRLIERVLCETPIPDWRERLAESFADMDLRLPGGETSREAMGRGAAVVREILDHEVRPTAVVTHGCLMTLMLKRFDDGIDFGTWERMSHPDVYRLEFGGDAPIIHRVILGFG